MRAGKEGAHSKGFAENIIKFLRAFNNAPVNNFSLRGIICVIKSCFSLCFTVLNLFE